jgi:hypothetical protein
LSNNTHKLKKEEEGEDEKGKEEEEEGKEEEEYCFLGSLQKRCWVWSCRHIQ